jgi:Met-zincin/Domain of unknown function (DUF5117)/Domain of unknown function (DUF5118)
MLSRKSRKRACTANGNLGYTVDAGIAAARPTVSAPHLTHAAEKIACRQNRPSEENFMKLTGYAARDGALAAAFVTALITAGCATLPSTPAVVAPPPVAAVRAAPSASTASPTAAAASGPSATPPLRPFADLIKDAKKIEGLFTLYEKDDKVYLELTPAQLGQLYFLQLNVNRGLPDDRALSARRMVGSQVIAFKRQHNSVQLLARNFKHVGESGTPLARAVANITSDSLLASAPVLSQPHPEKKSFLVEANTIFFADLMNVSAALEAGFRSGYVFDGRNSAFSTVRSTPTTTSLTLNAHFATPRLPTASGMPTPSPVPPPSPTKSTPDARSFFMGLHYSLARLPELPMRARLADDRIGHFNNQQWNYSNEAVPFARQYVVRRWRLERADDLVGTNTLAEPKKPITFWIDRAVPIEYREAVRDGALEWNKAFEKIGFKNAIVVKQQEDNDDSDTNDTMRASVHWFVDYGDGALAVGPSVADPRTGELLDADISMGAGWARLPRRNTSDQFLRPPGARTTAHEHGDYCNHGEGMLEEASFAMDLLQLRGQLPSEGPEALAIAQNVVKGVMMHEVGHTLGLRHNFRSSIIYNLKQLSDPEFVSKNGLTGSIMDYVPFNIALKGETQGTFYGATLGPYDYWAIEYAYKEFSAADEKSGLAAIANRSAEPLLAYATDEEIQGDGDGMDPDVNQRDLGDDPIAYAKRRIALTRELWDSAQSQPLATGESNAVQRRRVESGMVAVETALGFIVKNIGGVTFLRDHAGTGRANYTPIAAQRQRDALNFISDTAFRDETFALPAEFMSRLPTDSLDRLYEPPQMISFGERISRLHRSLMDRMLSEKVAQRVLETPTLMNDASNAVSLDEVYTALENAVWADATGARDVSPARRALQREHAKRIATALTRPAPANYAAEARALHRQTAKRLVAKLDSALRAGRANAATRAHFDEVKDSLSAALTAQMARLN